MIEDWKSYRYTDHKVRIYLSLLLGLIGIAASIATIYALPLEGATKLSCGPFKPLGCSEALKSDYSKIAGSPLGVFGVFYLYFSTRNRERLALIEKGADASIFIRGKQRTAPIWKVLILNLALLLIGIGVGIFIASILTLNSALNEDAIYPATIFTMAGVGLFVGYTMTKNLDKE